MAQKKAPPPPSPAPEQRSEEGSSPASERASASSAVVADAGPEFDPTNAPPPVEQPPQPGPAAPLVEWDEQAIADLLGIKGRVLHAALGAAEEDWIYTELDLAAIAPPLTRICNRYDPVRQYAGYGDPITVAVGMAGYFTRSVMERRIALADAAPPATEHPIPPADAPPPPPAAATEAPAPPPPRQATALPPQGTGSRTATPPPPPPPAAINADEVAWERNGG